MGLASGRLNRRIRLERFTSTQDPGSGGDIETWMLLGEVSASKRDVSDTERVASATVSAEITTRFQILLSPDVADLNAKDRIVYKGRTYDIVGVKEIEGGGLEITANARADV